MNNRRNRRVYLRWSSPLRDQLADLRSRSPVSSALCVPFGDLPIDPELTSAFSPFFDLKVHFLFETAGDLGL